MDEVEKAESRHLGKSVGPGRVLQFGSAQVIVAPERVGRQAQMSSKLASEAAAISHFSQELVQLLLTISSLVEHGPPKAGASMSRSQRCRG